MASATTRSSAAPWFRGLVTLVGTVVVVVLEFGLLTAVYHSGDGARNRHQAYVGASSALAAWTPGASTAPVSRAYGTLDGASGNDARTVRAALARWERSPSSTSSYRRLAVTTARLGDRLAHDERFADWRAAGIHASLLAFVSVGWFLWFRRVVRRHRDLERALTETQVAMVGERRLTALVRNSSDMLLMIDPDMSISYASPSILTVTGRDPELMTGRPIMDMVSPENAEVIGSILATGRDGDHAVTLRAKHADGRPMVFEATFNSLLADDSIGAWVLTMRDVTERIRLQDELTQQALQDALTGLANRRLFCDRLAHALSRRADSGQPLVVLFLDLDDFKNVNDSHGHSVGDQVLVTVGERVAGTIRQGDTAARFGGDEFAVLMEGVEPREAQQIAERLVASIAEPIVVDDVDCSVRVSIGMATAIPGVIDAEEALRNADVAMYSAKDSGKSIVAIYDAERHAEALSRLELQAELAAAIREGQLRLHYQPNVDLATGEVIAFEALVRWQHPTRGLLPPFAFVPMAEATGLVVPMGTWVLREACRAAVEELTVPGRRLPDIAVNVSARQIAEPGFVDLVMSIVTDAGLDPERVKLEIIESTLLEDRERVVDKLTALRGSGIRVAVDDFGTGYSSLSYLADLPVDVLKVDKSFVDQICNDGGPLVDAIVRLGESLHMVTVAEGVETAEQARRLCEAGCPVGQGYLWSRPVPIAEARDMLVDELTGLRFKALYADDGAGPSSGGGGELAALR